MATATRSIKSFKVSCPCCGDIDASMTIDLNDLGSITCNACDETFSVKEAVAKVTATLRRWEAVGRWIEMAPDAMNDPE